MNQYRRSLYSPFLETFQDDATNGNFSLSNLFFDNKTKIEPPKNALDAAARHFVTHGRFPEPVKRSVPVKKEDDEAVKEDTTMPSIYSAHLYNPYRLQEGGNAGCCNCGKPGCPICGKKSKLGKLGMSEAEGNSTGIGQQVGLGTPQSTANHLYQIPINQYQSSDANFVGDGESEETSKTNIPALLAAKNAGGQPHPLTISNGINKRAGSGGFKLKPLRDDLGPNG